MCVRVDPPAPRVTCDRLTHWNVERARPDSSRAHGPDARWPIPRRPAKVIPASRHNRTGAAVKIAILDDYRDTVRTLSVFRKLEGHDVRVFTDHVQDTDVLKSRLA